jgi:hypothetical protein
MKVGVALLLVAACFATSGCSTSDRSAAPAAAAAAERSCPAAWKSGWQRLANRISAPVYCPTWMPSPLTALIGGPWDNGVSVDKRDRSYLVSFLYHESQTGDVHVNFRAYPGRTRIPTCTDVQTGAGRPHRTTVPCFADPHGHRRVRGIDATVYTVNQDADQWHVLYAWRKGGSLYTVSEHVAKPLTFRQVVRNLDRLLRGLVVVKPSA